MNIREQAQQVIAEVEKDKHELNIRAEGMIAGILLLLQRLEEAQPVAAQKDSGVSLDVQT